MQRQKVRRAVVVGSRFYGAHLAKLINEHSVRWRASYFSSKRLDTVRASLACANADAVICFGGPGPNVALVEIARSRRIPVVVIWSGTDVLTTHGEPHLLEVIKRYGFTNIADGEWLVDEVRRLGIDATYVPVTAVRAPSVVAPLPGRFSVLSYLPEPRRSFYGEKLVYSIARQFPDIPFRIVGRGARNPAAPPNVEFLGHVRDMPARIDDATVLLRMPQHDGKSQLVLEALAHGRHVIWNYDFPAVHHAQHEHDAVAILGELKALHDANALAINDGARREVSDRFSASRIMSDLEGVLDAAPPLAARRRAGTRRVAISGLNLFVAQVAHELELHDVGWTPQVLRTSVRLEVLTSLITLIGCDVWYSIGSPISDRWVHLFSRILQKPRVIHWVGSDITQLGKNPNLRAIARRPNVRNLAEVDWTIAELRELGIQAELAPLPPRLQAAEVEPLPERFTILLYLPRTRGEFYGRREYERLIRAMGTRAHFIVVGGGELYAPPEASVERLGWRNELADVYRRTTLLIRFTKHDGLSLMTLEALTHGRYVLWSEDFPYTTHVRSYEDIEREVRLLADLHERGELAAQTEAARYVGDTYEAGRCLQRIAAFWSDAVQAPQITHIATESA